MRHKYNKDKNKCQELKKENNKIFLRLNEIQKKASDISRLNQAKHE